MPVIARYAYTGTRSPSIGFTSEAMKVLVLDNKFALIGLDSLKSYPALHAQLRKDFLSRPIIPAKFT